MTTELPAGVVQVADGFWNLRGSYKVKGLVDIGTQASLVRLASGKFVLLDSVPLTAAVDAWIGERTRGGDDIEAILHLHPFHTIHVPALHRRFAGARLYGTARHRARFADLPWERLRTEDAELHAAFADDFEFSIPRGVDFIPANETLHFSSVLAFHRATKTLHVDDTLLYMRLPWPLRAIARDVTRLHPTLGKVLQRRRGAVADFRGWAAELVHLARGVDNLCAAHSAVLLAHHNRGASVAERIASAVARADKTLERHALRHDR